ncbi:gamma-glutamyltransferase family protein [Streptomyces lincolnensis]|uniref:LmbA n=2 Tax=Streptomyces lincolnensis TaxID=1915 RepID=A9Y8R1_STRLN|nr:gamma-glutamyltransferase family protein [Streptomyces lincolnensis]ABX00597.1 LmbA [Streptomyces lincolnensis]QMV04446.1 gamma-glutamyltransferase family protein [Streptomyces lincolnensis]QMV11878.1 gamma-glutamyltransferase family protein [Streptomyces lincolnensis]
MLPSKPELSGTIGAVSATHWLASNAGMRILENGGNAFDAAVAAGFVLQVVEPHFNGPGGDVSIVALPAGAQDAAEICGQGPMPRAATPQAFSDLGLEHIPGSGLLPACVPGAFGGWLRLLAEFGTLRLADVLAPAITYAEEGYPLLPETAHAADVLAPLFRTEWTGSGQIYLANGAAPKAGSRFRNPALAQTYRQLLKEAEAASADREAQIEAAHQAFYQGFVAEAIQRFLDGGPRLDATGRRHSALLTADDLAAWTPSVTTATSRPYGAYRVHKPGPWSQGPVFLQQLALLEGFDLAGMRPDSADYLHTVVECAKLAFADRDAWYGDPAFTDIPLADLLSDDYTRERRRLVGPEAVNELQPGTPGGRSSWLPGAAPEPEPDLSGHTDEWMGQLRNGLPTILKATTAKGDTCCVTVTDRHGNTVAATPSGGWLKSSPAIAELGFPLGTRGQTMYLAEGHPNSLAGGKRPRTTLSPTVVQRDGQPHLAFGTPGGDRQDQWTLQFFLGVTAFGLDLQAATETLAFHTDQVPASFTPHQSRPGVVVVEENCAAATVAELTRRGHRVERVPAYSLGRVCATGLGTDGLVRAAASPRGRQPYAICG